MVLPSTNPPTIVPCAPQSDVQASLRAFFHPHTQEDVHWQSYLFWRMPGKLMNAPTWVRTSETLRADNEEWG